MNTQLGNGREAEEKRTLTPSASGSLSAREGTSGGVYVHGTDSRSCIYNGISKCVFDNLEIFLQNHVLKRGA